MHPQNATGPRVPTLIIALASAVVAAACATKPIETTYSGQPTVTSIIFQDFAHATLPDVLAYSSTKPTRTTATPPPSYGAIRVEFDRPLDGSTLAEANSLEFASGVYCPPKLAEAVQLIDVADGNKVIAASVCYDATSPLNQFPGIVLVPGSAAPWGSTVSPFTCNSFSGEFGDGDSAGSGNILKAAHQYALKFNSASIKDAKGNALSTPSTAGWAAGQYTFTTDDFSLMAVGFQDQANGLYNWFSKPSKGFMADLDPLPADKQVVCETNAANAKCELSAFDTPILLLFSSAVDTDGSDVTITRADGSEIDGAYAGVGEWLGDGREITVWPGLFWESGASYKVTILPSLTGSTGTVVSAADAKTFTFSVAVAPAQVLSFSPAANLTGVTYTTAAVLNYQEPIDPALVDSTHFQLLKGTTPVDATVTQVGGWGLQRISIAPVARMDPETLYTIKATGLKVAPGTPNAGKTIADFTSSFTTATFRSTLLAGTTTSATNIDRNTTQNPSVLRSATGLSVAFTNVPTTASISNTSVVLSELTPTATGGITTTPVDPSKYIVDVVGGRAHIQVTDTTYPLKYGQRYQVKLATSIVDSVSGKNLKAEGCTGSDCSDVRSFQTLVFAPSITAPTSANRKAGKFTLGFNVPVKADSVNSQLGTIAVIYKQKRDIDGVTLVNDGAGIPAPCTAVVDGATSTTCQPAVSLEDNKRYLISVVFPKTAPLATADTLIVGGVALPTDPVSGKFFGNRVANFITNCP